MMLVSFQANAWANVSLGMPPEIVVAFSDVKVNVNCPLDALEIVMLVEKQKFSVSCGKATGSTVVRFPVTLWVELFGFVTLRLFALTSMPTSWLNVWSVILALHVYVVFCPNVAL